LRLIAALADLSMLRVVLVPAIVDRFARSGERPIVAGFEATGMAAASGGGPIVLIDTENRRAEHYADQFVFQHIDFAPPYGPLDYLAALQEAERATPSVIIIDSLSYEHDGEGGTLDCVTAGLDRLAGTDPGLQQKLAAAAWRRPKAARRALLSGLLRVRAHVVVCIRATKRTRMTREAMASERSSSGLPPSVLDQFKPR